MLQHWLLWLGKPMFEFSKKFVWHCAIVNSASQTAALLVFVGNVCDTPQCLTWGTQAYGVKSTPLMLVDCNRGVGNDGLRGL